MPARMTLIGYDGMDYEILLSLLGRLPNISRIAKEGVLRRLDSVFPPDSDTAWASIFTGLNPAQHGVVKFVDPLEKSVSYLTEEPSSSAIRGKCIWDSLSETGARVCVVLPHAASPPWPVNGIMLSRSSLGNEVRVVPDNILTKAELNGLKAPKGLPGSSRKSLRKYLAASQLLFENTKTTALKLHDQEDWDFFFMYSPILDIVPHFFWRHYDRLDPAYPGPNEFDETIPQLYANHDVLAGEFIGRLRKEDSLIIMSDHGHGRRPRYEFKMNEVFRREGLLHVDATHTSRGGECPRITYASVAKTLVQNLPLGNVASSLMRHFPNLRTKLVKPSWIDWTRTIAATVDLSGIKSYSYGGIRINKAACTGTMPYEDVRQRVITLLKDAVHEESGVRLSSWVKFREDLYQGPFISTYPDLVCQLHPDYGFNPNLGERIIEESRMRHLVPGTHLAHNAVLAGIGPEMNLNGLRNLDILGIRDWVLSECARKTNDPLHKNKPRSGRL